VFTIVILFYNSPLPSLLAIKNDFFNPSPLIVWQSWVRSTKTFKVFERISLDKEEGSILVVPYRYGERNDIAQKVHGRDVYFGFINTISDKDILNSIEPTLAPSDLYDFKKFIAVEDDDFLKKNYVRFVVVFKNKQIYKKSFWRKIINTDLAIQYFLRKYHEPYYDDEFVVAWKIDHG